MKVCITGGTGFIGRSLVQKLHEQGHTVSILSRRSDCKMPAGVEVVLGDLTDTGSSRALQNLVHGCDVVYHCAGELRDTSAMRRLHVDGTRRLLHAAITASGATSPKPIHWIQLSSVGAYGPPAGSVMMDRVVTEQSHTAPSNEYEVTKTEADQLVAEAAGRGVVSCTILRPSIVFGRGMPNQSLRAMVRMIAKGLFFYIGSPGTIVNYIHVEDVVEALLRCATTRQKGAQAYILSNDCTLEDMVESIADALHTKAPRLRLPEGPVRAAAGLLNHLIPLPLTAERIDALVRRTRYSSDKIRSELGFQSNRSVPAAMAELSLSLQQ